MIRAEGPQTHRKKQERRRWGPAHLDGLARADAALGGVDQSVCLDAILTAGFGSNWFLDDYLKIVRRSHTACCALQAGPSGPGRGHRRDRVAQAATGGPANTRLSLSFFKRLIPDLGWGYLPLTMLILVWESNTVNLTDGLDGLAISVFAIAAAAYTALSYVVGNRVLADYLLLVHFPPVAELTVFCGSLVGASLGFLWYNSYPAEIFMGDVGSLALGAALGTVAILIKQELLLFIVGGVFMLEGMSVVLQVGYFKATGGRRLFRMAPLHHHFELIGWSEPKDISRFVIAAIVFALFSLTTLKLR